MGKNVLAFLEERGFIEWVSDPKALSKLFEEETVTGYIGFDPTADSLHVGHLIPIMGLSWMQRMGHRPIFIAGLGTGLIGDPSGKSKERNLISLEQVQKNLEMVEKQFARFVNFNNKETGATIINNYDWLGKISLLDFLRDVGKYFSVNYMLNREYVRSRLEDPEKSISYTEFTYMLLQAYDFYHLSVHENCLLQMGGNDQQ
ncbi:MAG TPA: tyrosine--tRNA ligase, partial [Synergistaceae bacterium]|nr:tyrosine--tRNA ligase [Synergistaceae bacterium]